MTLARVRVVAVVAALGLLILWPSGALAADDPSIKGQLRTDIRGSMRQFIKERTAHGSYLHYDPTTGELLNLKLKQVHSGIVRKGNFYVSCADFADQKGRVIDMDLLVIPAGNRLRTSQAIVHAVDGKKRAYDLESK